MGAVATREGQAVLSLPGKREGGIVKLPTGDEKHSATVTRTATKDGGAVYHVKVTPESEEVIQAGSGIEGLTPGIWIASSVNIRLICLAQALVDMDKNRAPETVN